LCSHLEANAKRISYLDTRKEIISKEQLKKERIRKEKKKNLGNRFDRYRKKC
jgi:hypothetical protein